jgi:hypothetical protein
MMSHTQYSPNFLAYCNSQGKTPEQTLEDDLKKYPGGIMCGFVLWTSKMKEKFYKARPSCFLDRWTIRDTSNNSEWIKFLRKG